VKAGVGEPEKVFFCFCGTGLFLLIVQLLCVRSGFWEGSDEGGIRRKRCVVVCRLFYWFIWMKTGKWVLRGLRREEAFMGWVWLFYGNCIFCEMGRMLV